MRRPNGTGTIVKLSGNRRKPYAVRVSTRDNRGYVVQKTLSYHTKASEAQAALDAYNISKEQGRAPSPLLLDYTVQNVYDGWSAREYKKLEAKGSKSSLVSHKAAWNKRVSRYAGRKMRDVGLDEWQSILDEDEDNGLSQSTINNDAILIRALYAYSMERDIVGKDYAQYLDVPSVDPKSNRDALSDLQVKKLEQMAAAGYPWADTVLMLCYTGFRITEFLTLTPFAYHADGDYLQCGIKTDAGRNRIVPVHPKIKPYLMQWLSKGGDTILSREDGRRLEYQTYRQTMFQPVVDALEIPQATPHWCRHTFATRLYTAGVDELARKLLLGHSIKKDVTAGYTHLTPDILAAAVRKIA